MYEHENRVEFGAGVSRQSLRLSSPVRQNLDRHLRRLRNDISLLNPFLLLIHSREPKSIILQTLNLSYPTMRTKQEKKTIHCEQSWSQL